MMPDHPDLFVAWQDTVKRGIYPVARLRVRSEPTHYEFCYIQGARQAQDHGFVPFDSFPELTRSYRGRELFPFFKNRVMPPTRPDYAGYVSELGLSVDSADPVELLARSGGRRVTDRLEIYAAPRADQHSCVWHFLLRGVRHLPVSAEERISTLHPGDRLCVMRDVQNEHNPKALLLRSEDKVNLGYIPDLLVDDLADLDLSLDTVRVTVERVNLPPSPAQHRVLCQLRLNWPKERQPFRSERFSPLSE